MKETDELSSTRINDRENLRLYLIIKKLVFVTFT